MDDISGLDLNILNIIFVVSIIKLFFVYVGQQVILNIIESDNYHSIRKKLLISSNKTKQNILFQVTNLFIYVLFSAIYSFYFFLLSQHIDFRTNYLLIDIFLSIAIALFLFAILHYAFNVIVVYVIGNKIKNPILSIFYLFFIVLSYPFRQFIHLRFRHESAILRSKLTFNDISEALEKTDAFPEQEQEKKLVSGVLNFFDLEVKEIMRARVDVVAFEKNMPFKELIELIIEAEYTRYPVYEERLDNIIGILHIKNILPYIGKGDDVHWSNYVHPALFVPENMKISELLRQFQLKKTHFAIVVDEYGGTSGIVTLEDIIEEIVGEIDDEFDIDNEGLFFQKIDELTYIFDGKTSLNDVCKITNLSFDTFEEVKGEVETLAGLILLIEGKFPTVGQSIQFKNIQLCTEEMDHRRIQKVKIVLPHEN